MVDIERNIQINGQNKNIENCILLFSLRLEVDLYAN